MTIISNFGKLMPKEPANHKCNGAITRLRSFISLVQLEIGGLGEDWDKLVIEAKESCDTIEKELMANSKTEQPQSAKEKN